MQLTLHSDYALRALIHLAFHDDHLVSTADISRAYGISQNHLVKVMLGLSEHGYIQTVRGRQGGVKLAKAPEEIRLGDVVRDMEPNFRLAECFDPKTNSCPITPACALIPALRKAGNAFIDVLNEYTLLDAIQPIRGKTPADYFLTAAALAD